MDLKTLSNIPVWDWPEEANHVIIRTLTDESVPEGDRQLAAEMAGDLGEFSDNEIATLLNIISSPKHPEEIRGSIAISLGPSLEEVEIDGFEEDSAISESAYKKIQRTFKKVFDDSQVPKLVRRRVLEASVRSTQPWHADAVGRAYAEADPEWQLTAVFCMQYVQGFREEILKSLASDDQEIRYHAISAAGNWEIKEAWPEVSSLLRGSAVDREELIAAIEAAGSLNPVEAAELIGRYVDDEDEEVAEAAMDALSMLEGFTQDRDPDFDEEDEDEEDV